MGQLITLFLLFISLNLWGQKEVRTTQTLWIGGEIQKEMNFGFDAIEKYPSIPIGDVAITNHMGEPRGTASGLTGVLIKDMIKDVELNESNPKLWSEFYFVFVAADGYKVVYSWNEIFNSPTGDNLYLITSRDGRGIREMNESLLVLTPTDFKTGRRHIKGTSKIIVKRVQD